MIAAADRTSSNRNNPTRLRTTAAAALQSASTISNRNNAVRPLLGMRWLATAIREVPPCQNAPVGCFGACHAAHDHCRWRLWRRWEAGDGDRAGRCHHERDCGRDVDARTRDPISVADFLRAHCLWIKLYLYMDT